MSLYWMLDARGELVETDDVRVWGQWFETAERQVAQDTIGDVRVSTVFIGLDHSFGSGPPLLWESMIFGGPLDGHMDRYTSRAAAIDGHQAMVAEVRKTGGFIPAVFPDSKNRSKR